MVIIRMNDRNIKQIDRLLLLPLIANFLNTKFQKADQSASF
jgi:hypothetical protein